MNRQQIGAAAELTACAWLIAQGYEVFRNVVPSGPFDLVAMRKGEVVFIDVKSRSSGVKLNPSAGAYPELNRKILYVNGDQVAWNSTSITDDATHKAITAYLAKVATEY